MTTKKAASRPVEGAELVTEVMRLELRPGDVLIFRTKEQIRPEFGVYLQKQLRAQLPDNKVLLIQGEIEAFVISEADAAGEK